MEGEGVLRGHTVDVVVGATMGATRVQRATNKSKQKHYS